MDKKENQIRGSGPSAVSVEIDFGDTVETKKCASVRNVGEIDVHTGEVVASVRIAEAQRMVSTLSLVERSILTHLVEGLSNRSMSRRLGISVEKIESGRARLLQKLGARSTTDAIRIGIYAEAGLAAPNSQGID